VHADRDAVFVSSAFGFWDLHAFMLLQEFTPSFEQLTAELTALNKPDRDA
jgi:hypothetical protein